RLADVKPAAAEIPSEPVAANTQTVAVPPLDESDPFVRNLMVKLSSRPELAAWLATAGLIRGFVAALDDVVSGTTPAPNLPLLAPTSKFGTVRRGGPPVIGGPSHPPENGLADAV